MNWLHRINTRTLTVDIAKRVTTCGTRPTSAAFSTTDNLTSSGSRNRSLGRSNTNTRSRVGRISISGR